MGSRNFLVRLPEAELLRLIQPASENAPLQPADFWTSTPFSRLVRGVVLQCPGQEFYLTAGANMIPLEGKIGLREALDACGVVFESLEIYSNDSADFYVRDVAALNKVYKNGSLLDLNFDYASQLDLALAVIRTMGHRFNPLKFRCRSGNMELDHKRTVIDAIVRPCNELKLLEYDDKDLAPPSMLWMGPGSSLEELVVTLRCSDKEKNQ